MPVKAAPQYTSDWDFFDDVNSLYRLAQLKGVAPSPGAFIGKLLADMHSPGDKLGPELEAERVAQGLCAECGRPIDFSRSGRSCPQCLDRDLKAKRARMQRARCG